MNKLLVFDNYDSFTFNLVNYVKDIGTHEVEVYRNDAISLEELDRYDSIILSPGPGLPADAGILIPLIKKYASTKKILGVCLGMQAIGEAFGSSLTNLEKVFHGVATPIFVKDPSDILLGSLYPSFTAGRYHSWVINKDSLPECLLVTATDENGELMAIQHKSYPLYAVQFHPESILTPQGKTIIQNFLNL
ncbi:MAG: aminodeoxychorismate/anthranilate synthase component II [Saprospiraceae bacterium]|nr:aminodeoxychorismate/anthranilate synthase component II [Saprospiraceae bacterium]